MANDERKLAAAPLIPLEIDAASILSLSKGVIFDTIVHNIEYTLNNRRTDPLPWKLIGMSLICDSSRNKNYMQKLQKMQCVPSVICTQIYHSKLVKAESGALTTPGRKIILATNQHKRLTGIIVCRSIDELLYLESSNTDNVHFIQYKLLSYERIATRELVNGPKLPAIGDKIIKTVFDFDLTQNSLFPRQLLPVAIISFGRQEGCDLCASIRSFLKLEEHKTFDKSYLVTSTNVTFDRLREEQERKEDAEAEQETAAEKLQRRQPLADLSKKSTDTGNARPSSIPQPSLRVPPLKIKVPRPEKPSINRPPLDSKFQCALKLNRINLSLYDISNLPDSSQIRTKKLNESTTSPDSSNVKNKKLNGSSSSPDSINNKTKSFNVTKPHEHHKSLKRLTNSETKKQSSPISEKRNSETISIRSSTSDVVASLRNDNNKKGPSSISSMSPIYRPKSVNQKQTVEKPMNKKKVQRPVLPREYHCSLSLSRIDLSMYNIDLPTTAVSANTLPMDLEMDLTVSTSPSSSSSSEQQSEPTSASVEPKNTINNIQSIFMMEQEKVHEPERTTISNDQQFDNTNRNKTLSNIVNGFLTPDLNDPSSNSSEEVSPQIIEEPVLSITNKVSPTPMNDEVLVKIISKAIAEAATELLPTAPTETLSKTTDELLPPPTTTDEVPPEVTNETVLSTANDEYTNSSSSNSCIILSPVLPPLDDDPVLFSAESPQIPVTDTSDSVPQGCIIIVPCSDDDDDDYMNEEINDNKNNIIINDTDNNKVIESLSSPIKTATYSPLNNPTLSRVFMDASRLTSHRSSTSSSCSSISTSILHNQSPRSPLRLPETLVSKKIRNKKQHQSSQPINFNRFNLSIPLQAHEPLTDPRLIYRLQAITTDLRWASTCNQCTISSYLPPLFTSSTQMISYERKLLTSEFVDPRRESLKNAILNSIYERIKILIPNIFIINSNQFQKLLLEQTIFKTNCSIHLEYLLHKLKLTDDMNFFHMIKTNDEFQLSPFLLQLIFN